MKNKSSSTKKIALCGIFAALALVFMMLGGLTALSLSILVVCALMTMLLVVEAGEKTTWIYVAVTSVLALILLPDKLYAIEYIFFAAAYPMFKLRFERFRNLIAWPLKISYLDVCLLICLVLARFVFLLGDEYYPLSFLTVALGTLLFILYDFALSTCVTFYMVKLRKKLRIRRK